MRNLNIRLSLPFRFLLFGSLSRFERLVGMNSNMAHGDGHFVFIDCDQVDGGELLRSLKELQGKYDLGEILITSDDKVNSYRVWCFKVVPFRTLMRIISEFPYTDIDFIRWTARKGHATMRLTPKEGRAEQEVVGRVEGRENPMPQQVSIVEYETPRGKSVRLGYEVMADG